MKPFPNKILDPLWEAAYNVGVTAGRNGLDYAPRRHPSARRLGASRELIRLVTLRNLK